VALEKYLGGYLDRRMKYHIEEWQLATRSDVDDIDTRLSALENDTARISASTGKAADRLGVLEQRARKLREAK
jgi:hypothetical protein